VKDYKIYKNHNRPYYFWHSKRKLHSQGWKIIHSILLFKYKTNCFLHRTRNINLYKADYNMVLKIKWGEEMKQAEKNKHCIQHNLAAEKGKQKMIRCLSEQFKQNNKVYKATILTN
jgi:hypothetical protein